MGTLLSFATAAITLVVAVIAATRGTRSPMAPPLGRTSAALFVYEVAQALTAVIDREELSWIRAAAAALVMPTSVALVMTFVGERRRANRWLAFFATYFSGIALLSLAAFVVPSLRSFPMSDTWAWAMIVGIVPDLAWAVAALARHYRTSGTEERARTQLLLVAMLLGAGGALSDLVSIAGSGTPRLAPVGLIAASIFLAILCLRLSIIEDVRRLLALNVVAVAVLFGLLQSIAIAYLSVAPALLSIVSVALLLAGTATLRPLSLAFAESRARREQLATLGRLSAQMGHDLKNPLAAIRGAAQYLEGELEAGRDVDRQFLGLILEQADRLDRVIGDYERIGRAEAHRTPVAVAALLRTVTEAAQASAATHRVELGEAPEGDVALDRDLVAQALENLVRNAREASSEGTIRVSAELTPNELVIHVDDDGPGMDAPTRERALDDFFTTKAQGSGLGLAFVSRVARAHAGHVALAPRLPHGTRVALHLGLSSEP